MKELRTADFQTRRTSASGIETEPPRPPQPDFVKVRRDRPRLLTPLRRGIRHAYVRAAERGWFGLVPLEAHVVICGYPRSGTTMLHLMLKTAVADARSFGKERSAMSVARYTWPGRYRFLVSKKPSDLFRVDEISSYYRTTQTGARFVLNVRDPRSVLTSVYASPSMAQARPGYGLLHASRRGDGAFVGGCGLFEVPDSTEVEIAYRLPFAYWGHGYATEMARAVLAYGFGSFALPRIIGLTWPENVPSQRVLEKIGMRREADGEHYGRLMRVYSAAP